MKTVKLVTIGGGSSYTPELVEGMILRQDQIAISEWIFVDIPEGRQKLDIVVDLAQRMVQKAGLSWQIKKSLDLRDALVGADFVTSQFRVGQLEARRLDEEIPLSYGILGQETNGAGGIFKALRTIEAYKPIISAMKELCPEAWLINFTNPAGIVTEAISNYLGWERVIGLCNIPIGQTKAAAKALGLSESELTVRHVGLNHFHFHKVWDYLGQERTAELIDLFYGQAGLAQQETVKNISNLSYPLAFLKGLGMLPCDYHRYFFVEEEMLADAVAQYKVGGARAVVVQQVEKELFELYQDPDLAEKPKQLEQRGGAYYSDIACQLVCAILNDTHEQLTVSTKNQGAIPYLPLDCVVEVSSLITANGVIPLTCPDVPPLVIGYLQLMKQMELATVEAAMTGSYDLLLQAFMLNPLIPHGHRTEELLKDLLLAHEAYLPQFAETITVIKIEREVN